MAFVVMSLASAGAPAANAAVPAPVLKVSGTTLSWSAITGVKQYLLAVVRNPTTTRDTTYQLVTGTSYTLTPLPGQTVNYGLAAYVTGGTWAAEVTVKWPATTSAPTLKLSGTTLTWNALSGVSQYLLATVRNPTTTRDTTYQLVTGTSFTPPAVPGQTVNYGLAANVTGGTWATEVTINWPATTSAPTLKLSGTTLTWNALSGVSQYLLATVRNPTTTRDTTYQLVTGTSFTPPAVPGQTVNYGLAANVTGGTWATEVTINWPATTTTTTATATAAATTTANTTNTTTTSTNTTSANTTSANTTSSNTTTTNTTTTTTAPASGGLIVGLDASVMGWTDLSGRMNQVVSQAGPKWMRQEFDWSQLEPSRGVFNFSTYDQFMLLAAQNGVRVLPMLMDTPSWGGSSWNTIPADPSDYASFVAAMVNRYGPHGSLWAAHPTLAAYAVQTFELWNEPYYDAFNNGNYNPGVYANLVKAGVIAGRAADPGARFLLAADNQGQMVGSTWVWWVDALYQAVPDLNNYFDGVAVHPYGSDLTNLTMPQPGVAYTGYDQVRRLESIRQEFVNHGASDKPLWLTEIGWPTCSSGSSRCTTPTGQAANLTTLFNYARGSWASYVRAVFVYGYQDNGSDSTNPENDYGLVDYNGNAKPALSVFKTQNAMQ